MSKQIFNQVLSAKDATLKFDIWKGERSKNVRRFDKGGNLGY